MSNLKFSPSKTEEDYLKEIYILMTLKTTKEKSISTNSIAKQLSLKASSVTDMIKRLEKRKYIIYKKNQGVILSKNGKNIALDIMRKRKLWEIFLKDVLSLSNDEIYHVIDQLEHIQSEKLYNELNTILKYPVKLE